MGTISAPGEQNATEKIHSLDESFPGYIQPLVVYRVRFYVTVFLVIAGLIGNIIILKVMTNSKFLITKPQRILCSSLAVSDITVLFTNLITATIDEIYGGTAYDRNRLLCKLGYPIIYLVLHVNSWLLVYMTFERVMAVIKPLQVHDIFSAQRVKCVIISSVMISILWNAELGYRYDLIRENNSSICVSVNDYNLTNFDFIKYVMSELFVSVLPILIIIPANTALMIKMYIRRKKRQELGINTNMRQNESIKFNVMIISVTTTFVVLYLPYTLYMFITNFDMTGIADDILVGKFNIFPL